MQELWLGPFRFPLDQIDWVSFFDKSRRKPGIANFQNLQLLKANLSAEIPIDVPPRKRARVAAPMQHTVFVRKPKMRRVS